MRKKVPEKIVYYTDELNDDFAGTDFKRVAVDERFPYARKNPVWRFFAALVYYGVAMPLIWFYERVLLRVRIVGKKNLKKTKGQTCFLYGNHTGFIDAFTPQLISFPRSNKIVVSADTVSIKGLKTLVQLLGAVPVPTERRGMKKFMDAIGYHHRKSNITIYPEAHIWPYHTGVREFKDTSFRYPVKYGAPCVFFFTAYTAPKGFLSCFRKANVTVYVSEPVYPNTAVGEKEAQKELREKAYAFMKEKSGLSDYAVVEYRKKEREREK